MNRENKRRQYEKGYYKTHPCTDSFTCRVCGRLVVSAGAGSGHRNHCPNCLSSLHLDIEPGDRAADCGGVMDPVAVPALRRPLLQPRGGGRQPDEAHVHRHEAAVPAPLPPGADRGDDLPDGRQRQPGPRFQGLNRGTRSSRTSDVPKALPAPQVPPQRKLEKLPGS